MKPPLARDGTPRASHGRTERGPHGSDTAPPAPRAKRRNAVMVLYDSPLYGDWAAWMTCFWGLVMAWAPETDEPSALPGWLDTLLGVVVIVALFGLLPSWLRLQLRRRRWRRRQLAPGPAAPTPTGTVHIGPVPSPQSAVPPPRMPSAPPASAPPCPVPPPFTAPVPDEHRTAPGARHAPPADRTAGAPAHQDAETSLSSSAVLAKARDAMPHPVARAVRTLQRAHSGKEQYEAILDAAETLAICVSVTSAALLRKRGDGAAPENEKALHLVSMLRGALLGRGSATFGTWTNWLQEVSRLAGSHPGAMPAVPAPRPDDAHGAPLIEHLNALRVERNRAAHGDRPQSAGESALRVREIRPHFEQALVKAGFLTRTPWLLTATSSYRPATRTFDVVARDAMGDHPDFERRKFTWAEPVATNVFYVLDAGAPVILSPFVASQFCAQCGQDEVCYAAGADRTGGPADLKSFARGHTLQSPDLGDEIRALPVRGGGGG
ncbi:hypothetical protein LKM28_05300 [Streptomyces sp. CT1-17]|uniref:hypothetical protein n=1 Tax=Streptomyces sp. CT1-17 TaxID=2885642 RepID=UPI001D10740C|nr:hypothetical protein [Streptomyces sp. CT1-17]MCC2265698.1 hypothetical protein [Streptomyces sp. CT1-17]